MINQISHFYHINRESTHQKVYQPTKILTSTMANIVTALLTKNMDAATIRASTWKTMNTPYHGRRILARATIVRIGPMAIITIHDHICLRYTSEMAGRVVKREPCHRIVPESQPANSRDVAPCLSKLPCSIRYNISRNLILEHFNNHC